MAIHEAIVYEGQPIPQDVLDRLERASKRPINYDDIPPMTEKEMKKVAAMARERRAAMRKNDPLLRVPQQTMDKAKKLLGADYMNVLRRLIAKAVDRPEMLQDCL